MPVVRLFVSYRRATDGIAAGELVADLRGYPVVSQIFHDVHPESLPLGVHWPRELLEAVLRAEAVLPVLGPGWLTELQRRNRTPDGGWISSTNSEDWVRKEIALALGVGRVVIPVLVNGAGMPQPNDLPPDLQALPDQQCLSLPAEGEERQAALAQLVARVTQPPALSTQQTVWPWEDGPMDTLTEDDDSIYTRFGQRWSEQTERDSPHSYDYKFSILDPETRHRLRVMLLAAGQTGQMSAAFSLAMLEQLGQPRKFAHSEKKEGMFLQASCLVTDGMADGTARRVLLVMRDDYQIHDLTRETRRHVKGESCLHSTCLTAYHKLDNYGHVSTAVLNSLTNPNPWALFSRKLLVPDALIDCRFVGIGYNFSDPRREYLFVVWHIRTRQCPPTMLVPARQNVRYDDRIAKVCYDDPIWQTCEEVSQFDFEKAAVDRLVLERVLGIRFEDGRTGIHSPLVGFVRCNAFDLTHQNRQTPVRWFRDTVVLDLLRLYQQQIHRDRRAVSGSTPADLLADLLQHLRETVNPDRIQLDMELLAAEEPSEATACEPALRLVLRDEQRRPVHTFLVLAALTDRERLSTEAIESCQHQLRARLNGEDISALFVLQGVRSDQRYRLQGAVTVTTEQVPIHIIKVALLPSVGEPSVKDVAHGIIPVRSHAEGPVLGLLVTRSEDDELPRLPGGKVETEETVGQALVRELQEELDLEANEIQETFPVEKSGIVVRAVSPSTGRMTPYRFFPFVVRLNERGRARIKALVNQPQRSCWVAPVTLEVFRETGLGFDPTYARAILDRIPPEVLSQAAIVLE